MLRRTYIPGGFGILDDPDRASRFGILAEQKPLGDLSQFSRADHLDDWIPRVIEKLNAIVEGAIVGRSENTLKIDRGKLQRISEQFPEVAVVKKCAAI